MIILLGFKNFDEGDTEFSVTGPELTRLAAMFCPGERIVPTHAHVTFFYEGLTDEICNENLRETRRELAETSLELFPST